MPYKTSEEECLAALREAAVRLGHSPTKAEYESLGITPSSATVIRVLKGWNKAKERAGLETNPSQGSRAGEPPEGVSEEIRDRWAELSVDQRWHYRNTGWNTERTLRRRAELRSWLNDRKADSGCAQCGESDPGCLDFHHDDPEEKDDDVTKLVTAGYGKDRLRAECEKCTVLCANCHRKEHADETQGISGNSLRVSSNDAEPSTRAQRRAWVNRYKRERGCRRCDHEIVAALDLHHVEGVTKENAVSRFVSDGAGMEQIRAELQKCVVLCANCHRKEHDGES